MRRWHPGRGYVRLVDFGTIAVWALPGPPGQGMILAVYNAEAAQEERSYRLTYLPVSAGKAAVWRVMVPAGTKLLMGVYRSAEAIRWAYRHDPDYRGEVLEHRIITANHNPRHRRYADRRAFWPHYKGREPRLPRAIRSAHTPRPRSTR